MKSNSIFSERELIDLDEQKETALGYFEQVIDSNNTSELYGVISKLLKFPGDLLLKSYGYSEKFKNFCSINNKFDAAIVNTTSSFAG